MEDGHRHVRQLTEAPRELLGQGDRAVEATRAAERDPQLILALGAIRRGGEGQELGDELEEPIRRRLLEDEVADLRLLAGERLQLRVPVGVRQEADVEDEIGLERQAVLVAKGDDVDAKLVLRRGVRERATRAGP